MPENRCEELFLLFATPECMNEMFSPRPVTKPGAELGTEVRKPIEPSQRIHLKLTGKIQT